MGTDRTFLIIEAREPVPWTKPDELPYDPAEPLPLLGHQFRRYFLALMVSGDVVQFDDETSERDIRSWIIRTDTSKPDPKHQNGISKRR